LARGFGAALGLVTSPVAAALVLTFFLTALGFLATGAASTDAADAVGLARLLVTVVGEPDTVFTTAVRGLRGARGFFGAAASATLAGALAEAGAAFATGALSGADATFAAGALTGADAAFAAGALTGADATFAAGALTGADATFAAGALTGADATFAAEVEEGGREGAAAAGCTFATFVAEVFSLPPETCGDD
jgi:hypothetical protein